MVDAPVEVVWQLVGDPRSYAEWASDVVAVTGLPIVEKGAQFEQEGRGIVGTSTTTFVIDELDDLRRIRMHCTKSGYYSDWNLTEAQGETFIDVELGMEPLGVGYRVFDATAGKRTYRQVLDRTLAGLRESVRRRTGTSSQP